MTISPLARATDAASLKGMVLGTAAYWLFAAHDALVKSLVFALPVVEILLVRSVVIVIGTLLIGRMELIRNLRASPNKRLLVLRSLLMLSAWCMYYNSARYLQLAEMTTLYYVAPVVTLVLAVIFLGERLTLPRILAAAVGFIGVVVATNPVGLGMGWPEALVLAAAVCWSVAMILMRTISKSESALAQILFVNLLFAVAMVVATIFLFQPMPLWAFFVAVAIGLVGGVAQFTLVEAARLVPASVLGTVEYSALIWSFIFGYIFWAEVPQGYVYFGAALVVAAGLLLAWNERARRRIVADTP